MSSLTVGGVIIPVAPSGNSRSRLDLVDRARAFDGTYRASAAGNPKRDWRFNTPPVARGDADYYETVLAIITAQLCSGDILGNNQLLWSSTFSNAAWTKTGATITGGIADQNGLTPAYTIAATAPAGFIQQSLSNSSSIVRTNSIWARRRVGSGTVQLRAPDGSTLSTLSLSASWQKFSVTGAASVNRDFVLFVNTSGDQVDISDAQLEDGSTAGAYSETTTSASPISCFAEILSRTPIAKPSGHRAVLEFALHEA